jgi:hypothetical protein
VFKFVVDPSGKISSPSFTELRSIFQRSKGPTGNGFCSKKMLDFSAWALLATLVLILHERPSDAITFSIKTGQNETIIVVDDNNRAVNVLFWTSGFFMLVIVGLIIFWLKMYSTKGHPSSKYYRGEDEQVGVRKGL